jgi:hypothetical protein
LDVYGRREESKGYGCKWEPNWFAIKPGYPSAEIRVSAKATFLDVQTFYILLDRYRIFLGILKAQKDFEIYWFILVTEFTIPKDGFDTFRKV